MTLARKEVLDSLTKLSDGESTADYIAKSLNNPKFNNLGAKNILINIYWHQPPAWVNSLTEEFSGFSFEALAFILTLVMIFSCIIFHSLTCLVLAALGV